MKHVFITYGDAGYEAAKSRIVEEARRTGEFDNIIAYSREDLSEELLQSDIINVKRGGGLWSWKPDIILTTMEKYQDGDAIVYCDAGCSLYPSREWNNFWQKLEQYDMIAQRIYQRTDQWTRKELLDYFAGNGHKWLKLCQFQATTIIIIISEFTLQFITEWQRMMIDNPKLVMDVTEEEKRFQLPQFIENRHDQAIYSALIYKYLQNTLTSNKIYTQWEHIEDLDLIYPQAIRATRLRLGEIESPSHRRKAMLKRIVKDYIYKLFYYAPLSWWHNQINLSI